MCFWYGTLFVESIADKLLKRPAHKKCCMVYESKLALSTQFDNSTMFLSVVGEVSEVALLSSRWDWMIYRGPGFLAAAWFGSSPTPFAPSRVSISKLDFRKRDNLLTRGGGGVRAVGKGPEYTTTRKPSLPYM